MTNKKFIFIVFIAIICALSIQNIYSSQIFVNTSKNSYKEDIVQYNVSSDESIRYTLIDTVGVNEIFSDTLNILAIYKEISEEMEKMASINSVDHNIQKNNNNYVLPPYKISKDGENLIKKFEKLRLNKYLISGEKYYTIGWGHQIKPGERIPDRISKEYADKLFSKDVEWVNDAVNRLTAELNPNFKFTQGFIDCVCSLIYNCGEYGVQTSRLWTRLHNCRFNKNGDVNIKDYEYAIVSIKTMKIYMRGHIPRRKEEYAMAIKK